MFRKADKETLHAIELYMFKLRDIVREETKKLSEGQDKLLQSHAALEQAHKYSYDRLQNEFIKRIGALAAHVESLDERYDWDLLVELDTHVKELLSRRRTPSANGKHPAGKRK
jgi:hypothetical protein